MNLFRILIAFVLAPLATPFVFDIAWLADGTMTFDDIRGFSILTSIFSYSATILFGIPLTLVTRGMTRSRRKIAFVATGGVAGLFTAAILYLFLNWFSGVMFYLLCFTAGGLSGFVFWVVAFREGSYSTQPVRIPGR